MKIRIRNFQEAVCETCSVAYKPIQKDQVLQLEDEDDLIFVGLISMMDPPREESKAAVADCSGWESRPIMITGDHKVTAAAIANELVF